MVEIVNELFQKLKEEARQQLSRMNEAEKVIYSSDTTFTDCLDKFPPFKRFGQVLLCNYINLHTHTHTHTHTHKMDKNGQMLSPPRLSTSPLRSVAEIASLPLETGPPCATWSLGASAAIHLELGQSHPGALTMAQLWD